MVKKIIDVNIVNHDGIVFGDIHIENGKIKKIIEKSKKENKARNYCLPGFIDQHTHGGYGVSFDHLSKENYNELNTLGKKLSSEGVCGIFVTTVTQDLKKVLNLGNFLKKKNEIVLGWHIEGPFISVAKKGAHNEKFIININSKILKEIDNTNNLKKIITIAPEIKENMKVIKNNKIKNIYFSIGHSNASYEVCKKAVDNGCSQFTHLYNAMSGFDHRSPGIVNYALYNDKTFVELIADGVHINDSVLKETYKISKPERIIIISDSLSPKGLKNGKYHLGSLEIDKKNNQCFLADSNTLAGSTMKYNDIVKHFFQVTKCSFSEIVKVTSYNTCKQFNIKEYGKIKKNAEAKLIIIDSKLNIIETTF
ncbi:MAG: N-acetylglucosamine-6-phosphate deacetylase [Mycoplasmoidaceae bacterium]